MTFVFTDRVVPHSSFGKSAEEILPSDRKARADGQDGNRLAASYELLPD